MARLKAGYQALTGAVSTSIPGKPPGLTWRREHKFTRLRIEGVERQREQSVQKAGATEDERYFTLNVGSRQRTKVRVEGRYAKQVVIPLGAQ